MRGDETGHELDEITVGVAEVIRLVGQDHEHSDGLAALDQWCNRHRTRPFETARLAVDTGVGFGVTAEQWHAHPNAQTRQARFEVDAHPVRVLGGAADGPVDHCIAFDQLHRGAVGPCDVLHPLEHDGDDPLGVVRAGVDQPLCLDEKVQAVEVRLTRNRCHPEYVGRTLCTLEHNRLG